MLTNISIPGGLKRLNVQRLLVLLVLVFALLLVSCATSSKKKSEADAKYKLGVSELRAGNTQAAFIKFHEAERLDPGSKEIQLALGDVYIRLDDFENAEKHLKRTVAIDRKYSEGYNFLCYLNYRKEQYDAALKYCNKALENVLYSTPEYPYYNMGKIYYDQRQFDKAIEAFKDALRRNSAYFQGYYALALAYNAKKMYGPASEAIGNAIVFDPRFQGDRVKAEQEFKRLQTVAENPREYQAYIDILHY